MSFKNSFESIPQIIILTSSSIMLRHCVHATMDNHVMFKIAQFTDPQTTVAMLRAGGPTFFKEAHATHMIGNVDITDPDEIYYEIRFAITTPTTNSYEERAFIDQIARVFEIYMRAYSMQTWARFAHRAAATVNCTNINTQNISLSDFKIHYNKQVLYANKTPQDHIVLVLDNHNTAGKKYIWLQSYVQMLALLENTKSNRPNFYEMLQNMTDYPCYIFMDIDRDLYDDTDHDIQTNLDAYFDNFIKTCVHCLQNT